MPYQYIYNRLHVLLLSYIHSKYNMNFFNRYKDLFGVPNGTPIPKTKLTVNNQLFIDKPFVPTYKQTLSINSKLRDLRKDYNQLQQQIQSINTAMKSPKRALSRRSREMQEQKPRDQLKNSSDNMNLIMSPVPASSNIQNSSPFLKHNKKNLLSTQNRMNFEQLSLSNQQKDPFVKKKMTWLKDDQVNLLKHSEINYIFNQKMHQQNQKIKNMNDFKMPKAQNFMFGPSSQTQGNIGSSRANIIRNQPFKPTNRSGVVDNSLQNSDRNQPSMKKRESNKGELDRNGAIRRRQDAKKAVNVRRERLAYLLRTSW